MEVMHRTHTFKQSSELDVDSQIKQYNTGKKRTVKPERRKKTYRTSIIT